MATIRTKKQALTEAKRRWGAKAMLEHDPREPLGGRPIVHPKSQKEIARRFRFKVGVVQLGMFFTIRGEGDTWDAAFTDADARDLAERERIRRIVAEGKDAR